jgi:uroporphyrinogen decarboxylase
MKKTERVLAGLQGREVDRPPFSFWYHFGLQHLPGQYHAEAELRFFRAYDLDFLKVMSDYPYPMPSGLAAVEREDDWKRVEPLDGTHQAWTEQLSALSIISESLANEALFIETVFSPWTTARRMAPSGGLRDAMARFPETLLAAMDAIATSLAAYAREAVSRGASGIFLSLGAANADVMSREEYRQWGRPFDLKVLEAVRAAPFNVLHIHGNRIHFEEVADFPAAAFNWSHFATPPRLAEGKALCGKAVMGGINEATASHISAPEISRQVAAAIEEVGPSGLIITPGCSVPTDTPVRNLRAIESALEQR